MTEGALEPGARLGDYEILAELGGGGMGRVYRAKDLTLERIVALKTLAPQLKNDELLIKRFLMEARAAARLNHPNIVQIYDFGKEGETYYLAMEYVEGDSLAALLKRAPFPEVDAITITRMACQALSVAHAEGLVHRDIKPDNLMLTSRGDLKLVDLGVAKRVGEDAQSMTQTGQALGTPLYISPEQIRADKQIDGRADIYALGATLYHLVTGHPPFRGNTAAQIMSMHLYAPFDDPRALVPALSEGLVHVLRKMMAKATEDRYADVEALDRDLYQLEIGEAPEAASSNVHPASTTPNATGAVTAATVIEKSIPPRGETPAKSTPARGAPTQGQGPRASGASTSAPTGFTDPNLKTLETELARHVGPLARVLVKRAAKNARSLHDLIVELEREIPGDKPRKAFRAAVEKLR